MPRQGSIQFGRRKSRRCGYIVNYDTMGQLCALCGEMLLLEGGSKVATRCRRIRDIS